MKLAVFGLWHLGSVTAACTAAAGIRTVGIDLDRDRITKLAAGEPFVVPSQANNVAGGKEILRAMLSKAAATNFSKTRLAPTIVKGLVPSDGFGSTALVSQTKMLDAAGSNTFNYQFVDYYGMNTDQLVVWNSFLSGQTDVPGLTKGLQTITDKIANDPSVKKQTVT